MLVKNILSFIHHYLNTNYIVVYEHDHHYYPINDIKKIDNIYYLQSLPNKAGYSLKFFNAQLNKLDADLLILNPDKSHIFAVQRIEYPFNLIVLK